MPLPEAQQQHQQVDDVLASMGGVEQTKALKAQLNFRQHVLKQKPADPALKCVYSFSKADEQCRVQLSLEMLAANIKLLIKHSFELDGAAQPAHVVDGSDTATPILVALTGEEQWSIGRVISHAMMQRFGLLEDVDDILLTLGNTTSLNCEEGVDDFLLSLGNTTPLNCGEDVDDFLLSWVTPHL